MSESQVMHYGLEPVGKQRSSPPEEIVAAADNLSPTTDEETRHMEIECAVMAARIYDRIADIQKLRIENDQLSSELRRVIANLGAA